MSENRRPRIMALVYSMEDGGAERVVLSNLLAFKNDKEIDFKLFVYAYESSSNINAEIRENDLNVEYLTTKQEFCKREKAKEEERNRLEQMTWRKALDEYKPDIVHVHISCLLKNTLDPIIEKGVKIRFITLHSDPERFQGEMLNTIRRAYQEGNFIPICLNDYQKKKAEKIYGFTNGEIIHNGINYRKIALAKIDKREAREKLGISEDSFLVIGVGRVAPVKNYPLMIKVFTKIRNKYPNAKLLIAGRCGKKDRIKLSILCISEGVLRNVKFLGNMKDVTHVYCAADLLLMTSVSEGSSLSLIEAQYCGVKCIISPGVPSESIVSNLVTKVNNMYDIDEWMKAIEGNETTVGRYRFEDYDARIQAEKLKELYLYYWSQ